MLIGAAPQNLNGSDYAALAAAAGPWALRRSYETAAAGFKFTDWSACRGGLDVGLGVASLWSCKPDLVALGRGTYDAAITAFVETIPDGHVAMLGIWHEVDGKIRQPQGFKDPNGDTITTARWLDAAKRFCQAVHAAGKPNVYTVALWEAWSESHPRAGTTYDDLWPGRGYFDLVAFDGYSDVPGTPEAVWGLSIDWATANRVPWGIHEIGCKGAIDTDWMARHATWLHDQGAEFLSWFSNSTEAVPTPGTNSAAVATSRALSLAYQADPSRFAP